MTIDYNAIFSIAPSVLMRYPEITNPNHYNRFNYYITCSYYLKHAEIMRDLFLKNTQCKLTPSAAVGLGITAVVVAIKWVADEGNVSSEILKAFGFKREIPLNKYYTMEEVFLRAIDYRVHVKSDQLRLRYRNTLWNS